MALKDALASHDRLARLGLVLRTALFQSPFSVAMTLTLTALLFWLIPPSFQWAVSDAVFAPDDPTACRQTTGACWGFVVAKSGQILFGIYPPDERWRPLVVCVALLALLVVSARSQWWGWSLVVAWGVVILATFALMSGGVLGLVYVPTASWGGLPVTLILTVVAIGIAMPVSILLALARRSELTVIRWMCVGVIEVIRGLPLLTLLFVASIMLPLFLPESLVPDKFVRALVALTLFAAAYLSEVVRGGLQAVPRGQYEAARALGLGYWRTQRYIVLPQALQIVIPALANTVIVMIKNTSLVLVVGLFDLISSGKAALADPDWNSPAAEVYLFIGAIYFVLAFGFARFADSLERRGAANRR
ncbi:MAG: amino acid ABC transporter permease [Rhodospirillaceae bacterium]|nr:amino acid ABC transporter permease [Rhodospirillaceae bacterium]